MTEYKVKSTNYRNCVLLKEEQEIGKLDYQKWFSIDANIYIIDDYTPYVIGSKGFWGTTIELKRNDEVLLDFKMNWNSNIVLHSLLDNTERDFVFKVRGMLKSGYILKDKEGNDLLEIRPNFDWGMSREYSIMASDEIEALKRKEILLLSVIHCANYYMSVVAAGAI